MSHQSVRSIPLSLIEQQCGGVLNVRNYYKLVSSSNQLLEYPVNSFSAGCIVFHLVNNGEEELVCNSVYSGTLYLWNIDGFLWDHFAQLGSVAAQQAFSRVDLSLGFV